MTVEQAAERMLLNFGYDDAVNAVETCMKRARTESAVNCLNRLRKRIIKAYWSETESEPEYCDCSHCRGH